MNINALYLVYYLIEAGPDEISEILKFPIISTMMGSVWKLFKESEITSRDSINN